MIGVQLEPRITFVKLGFAEALRESTRQNLKSATVIYKFIRGIAERRMSPKTLQGPIGIAQLSGEAAREGPMAFIGLMAMVSLNLAVFNLLPIPILDGGVILLLLIEMVMRRDLSMQVKETVFKLGFVFLMLVVAVVLYNDLTKILPPG
jgi:regulator of sigma E protease